MGLRWFHSLLKMLVLFPACCCGVRSPRLTRRYQGGGTAPGRAGWGWDPGGFALVALGLSGAHCDYNSTVRKADACRCQHLSFCINIPCKKFMCRIQNRSLSWDKAQLSLRLTRGTGMPSQYRSWELEEERLLCVLVVLRVLWDFFFPPAAMTNEVSGVGRSLDPSCGYVSFRF